MTRSGRTDDTGESKVPGKGAKTGKSGVSPALRPQTDPRHKRRFKEFWLTSFAIDHPTSVFVMTLIVVIMGLSSYIRVPKESMPEIVILVLRRISRRKRSAFFLMNFWANVSGSSAKPFAARNMMKGGNAENNIKAFIG